MTIVDRLNVAHDENNRAPGPTRSPRDDKADICWTFDAAAYKAMLKRALA